jgi:hypothetical protein
MDPKAEPVGWGGAITALAVATFPLLKACGVNITSEMSAAILAFLGAVIVIVTLMVRSRVTPVERAQGWIDKAFKLNPETDAPPVIPPSKLSFSGKTPPRKINQPAGTAS